MTMYERIKEERIKKKMSQQELARLTGYQDRSSIAKIESGVVDLPQSKILLFAKVLDISPAKLMGLDDGTPDDLVVDYINAPDSVKERLIKQYGLDASKLQSKSGLVSVDLTSHENDIIHAYRQNEKFQAAVDQIYALLEPEPVPQPKNA